MRRTRRPAGPSAYATFLPVGLRSTGARPPDETWWLWQGHRVQVARRRRPDAGVRVLMVHGVGGHSGALWPFAALIADQGLDVAAVDLPLYGRTKPPDPRGVRYDDWVRLLVDLVAADDDGRPLVLVGASMGGLLACEVAARSPLVSGVVATCLLDPADRQARARMSPLGVLGVPGSTLLSRATGRVGRLMVPVRWVASMSRMSRSQALTRLCRTDPGGGGAHVPLGFLASYLRFQHAAPESVQVPVTLAHPADDRWTPPHLSLRVHGRLPHPGPVVMLDRCGHFPVEEPGVSALLGAVAALARDLG